VRIPAPGATTGAPGTPPTTPAGLRKTTVPAALSQAAEVLGHGQVDAIGYASTSSGYATGFDAETALLRRLSHEWDVPVAGTSPSAVDALRAFGVQKVALVHPPWFDGELNELGATYFQDQGFTVVGQDRAAFRTTRA
jgi:maleate isomerase